MGFRRRDILNHSGDRGDDYKLQIDPLRGNHSVRSERWRYTRYNDGSEELYDHEHDQMEWTNLAGQAQYKEVIAAHAAWLPKTDAPNAPRAERN